VKRRRWILLVVAALLAAVLLYAWQIEPRLLTVTHVELTGRLGEALAGKRLVLISDLHITADWRKARLLRAKLTELAPDYLLLGGDLVWYEREAGPVVSFLKSLPKTEATFAILGDADYMGRFRNCLYCHKPRSRELRTDVAIRFLRNEAVDLAGGKARLIGLDGENKSGWEPALAAHLDGETPTIVLAHYPESIDWIAPHRPDLVLAGDTHGGQIAILDRFLKFAPHHETLRYPHGNFVVSGVPMFVTRGVGESIIPLRLARPPEIVVLEGKR
jgi:uncharacterized protein